LVNRLFRVGSVRSPYWVSLGSLPAHLVRSHNRQRAVCSMTPVMRIGSAGPTGVLVDRYRRGMQRIRNTFDPPGGLRPDGQSSVRDGALICQNLSAGTPRSKATRPRKSLLTPGRTNSTSLRYSPDTPARLASRRYDSAASFRAVLMLAPIDCRRRACSSLTCARQTPMAALPVPVVPAPRAPCRL
jgi:hypothetical protein